jgi:serine/threonine protein kinase
MRQQETRPKQRYNARIMSLSAGTKLGPYEIQAPLGAGGMGEVYRARDTRLDRIVAIKVLPEHLSNPESKQRFEREARAVSSLNHPNICALYDIGTHNGVDFLVMEYLEGQTLAERLQKGALPIDQVLKIGIEIADALDKAHRQGILHRDLKPGNIMVTKSGTKLLDFGLARLKPESVPATVTLTEMATERRLTAAGMLVGTLQYMAPEQLEGKETDARTDIFALGVVIYEMITGRPAFSGGSNASLIAAILSSEPPTVQDVPC